MEFLRPISGENYGFIPVKQDSVLQLPAHGAGEDHFFEVASFLEKVIEGIAMGDADNILLNNRAIIEYFGHIVAGGADELYPARERLMVGFGAYEGRQERVMDIDNSVLVLLHKFAAQDLHEARQHEEIGADLF